MTDAAGPSPIRFDQTGLRGRTALLLTDLPTNDAGVPVDLPTGTTHVVILDDTPNPTLTLQVHPVGNPQNVAFVDHADLALTTPWATPLTTIDTERSCGVSSRDSSPGFARRNTPMAEPDITYYAVLGGDRTRDNPSGLVRRIHTTPRSTDEAFGRDLRWHPTEYLRKYFLGHNDDDHEEITLEEAATIISRWRVKWADEDRETADGQ